MDSNTEAAAHVKRALGALKEALIDGITIASANEIANLIMTTQSVIAMLEHGARTAEETADVLNGFADNNGEC